MSKKSISGDQFMSRRVHCIGDLKDRRSMQGQRVIVIYIYIYIYIYNMQGEVRCKPPEICGGNVHGFRMRVTSLGAKESELEST